jgi:hypothetical protein
MFVIRSDPGWTRPHGTDLSVWKREHSNLSLDSMADSANVGKNQVSDARRRRSSCTLTPRDHSEPTGDDGPIGGISHQRRDFRGAVAIVHGSTVTVCAALLSLV